MSRKRAALLATVALLVGVVATGVVIPGNAGPSTVDGHYVIASGDNWTSIGRQYGLTANQLAEMNFKTVTQTIKPGQVLHVPTGGTVPPSTTLPASTTSSAATTTAAPTTTTTSTPVTSSSAPATTTTQPATTTTVAPTSTLPATTTTVADGVLFFEAFSTEASLNRFVFDVHNDGTWPLRSFGGDHDHNCGNPYTYRPLVEERDDVNGQSEMIWWCAPAGPDSGHFMTGMNTEGYTIIAFSPKGTDGSARVFPANANRICWDQNLTDLGGRKWTQLAVVSDDTFIANGRRLPYRNPDFSDVAGETTLSIGADGFLFNNLRNSTEFFKGDTGTVLDEFGLPRVTDKAARYRHCVRDNGNGTVTRTQTRPGGQVHTITGPGSFPAGPRVFILEDDTYNADKDYDGPAQANPYTWHWDNIEISAG